MTGNYLGSFAHALAQAAKLLPPSRAQSIIPLRRNHHSHIPLMPLDAHRLALRLVEQCSKVLFSPGCRDDCHEAILVKLDKIDKLSKMDVL